MQTDLQRADELSSYIGEDFLTWLWYYSEQNQGIFQTGSDEDFSIYVHKKITVQGGEQENKERASSSGRHSRLEEAKQGLRYGKKASQAGLQIEGASLSWELQLKAEDFSINSLKTPKVDMQMEEGEDPDSRFLEKMYLIERLMDFLDQAFARFMQIRLSEEWKEEQKRLRQWIGG